MDHYPTEARSAWEFVSEPSTETSQNRSPFPRKYPYVELSRSGDHLQMNQCESSKRRRDDQPALPSPGLDDGRELANLVESRRTTRKGSLAGHPFDSSPHPEDAVTDEWMKAYSASEGSRDAGVSFNPVSLACPGARGKANPETVSGGLWIRIKSSLIQENLRFLVDPGEQPEALNTRQIDLTVDSKSRGSLPTASLDRARQARGVPDVRRCRSASMAPTRRPEEARSRRRRSYCFTMPRRPADHQVSQEGYVFRGFSLGVPCLRTPTVG